MEQSLMWFMAGLAVGLMIGIAVVVYITCKRGGM